MIMVSVRNSWNDLKEGDKIDSWTILGHAFSRGWGWSFVCRCRCNEVCCVEAKALKNRTSGKCRNCSGVAVKTHGQFGTRLYKIWEDILGRCYNTNHKEYFRYGGRGITVCEEWRKNPGKFFEWSYANGYADNLTIDRFPDKNSGYGPTNCRWATKKEQNNNLTSNHLITAFGETKTLTQWHEDPRCVEISFQALSQRLENGLTPERAITKPKPPRYERKKDQVMAGTHSELAGGAPEAAQMAVRAEMARAAAEGHVPVEAPKFDTPAENLTTEWYYLVDNKPNGPISTKDLQDHILKHGNTKVCPLGQSAWLDASENGFQLPEVQEPIGAVVPEPAVALGDTSNPKEEALETLPDNELKTLALTHGVIGRPQEFNRSIAVKALAAKGVTP